MKTFTLYSIGILLLLGSCKKEEDGNAVGSSIGYVLKTPSCLISSVNSISLVTHATYDSEKRIIRLSRNQDTLLTQYSYSGNKMLMTTSRIFRDGSTESSRTTYYLNNSGFIDSTIEEGSLFVTVYKYNAQGNLVRELEKNEQGLYYTGRSYQYINGNKVSEYSLRTDLFTGASTDSTLLATHTYYSNIPGKIDEWQSWVYRRGKGSVNALKTSKYGEYVYSYEYTLGTNSYPSQVRINDFPSSFIGWKCN
jgi:hypothetical protein